MTGSPSRPPGGRSARTISNFSTDRLRYGDRMPLLYPRRILGTVASVTECRWCNSDGRGGDVAIVVVAVAVVVVVVVGGGGGGDGPVAIVAAASESSRVALHCSSSYNNVYLVERSPTTPDIQWPRWPSNQQRGRKKHDQIVSFCMMMFALENQPCQLLSHRIKDGPSRTLGCRSWVGTHSILGRSSRGEAETGGRDTGRLA